MDSSYCSTVWILNLLFSAPQFNSAYLFAGGGALLCTCLSCCIKCCCLRKRSAPDAAAADEPAVHYHQVNMSSTETTWWFMRLCNLVKSHHFSCSMTTNLLGRGPNNTLHPLTPSSLLRLRLLLWLVCFCISFIQVLKYSGSLNTSQNPTVIYVDIFCR